MSSKKKLLALMLIGILTITVSCSSSKDSRGTDEKTKKDGYSVNLSDKDIDGGHIKLELNKNVTVDADITPISEYRDGVDSYYTEYIGEDNKLTYKKYKNTPVIFGYPVKDLMKMIEDNGGGKFTAKKLTAEKNSDDYFSGKAGYIDRDKKKGSLACYVETDKGNRIISETVYFMSCTAEWDEEGNTSDSLSKISVGTYLSLLKAGFDEADLSFGTKADIGEKMSALIKDITKTDNYGDCRCVVINEKTFSYVFENVSLLKDIVVKPLGKEYYVYFFPYKIDGFEWKSSEGKHITAVSEETEDVEFADDVAFLGADLYPLNASEQILACNEDGLAEMELYNTVKVSGKYKENLEVLPLNDVVSIVQDYFNGKAPLKTDIYNIKLCYTGTFSNPEDGQIRNIAKPYWCVEFTQKGNGSDTNDKLFIDVSTGDIY